MIIRPNTSDQAVYNQVYDKLIYDYPCPVNPRVILDLGAYTGISTRWFCERYPDALVIGVEPSGESFLVLQDNAPDAELHHCAVGGEASTAALSDPGRGEWAMTLRPGGEALEVVEVKAVPDILGGRIPDIVKMDIEGSEIEVFRAGGDWLQGVSLLLVEHHDRFVPGCQDAMFAALERTGREWKWEARGGSNVAISFRAGHYVD